jgi:hypothetical protein
MWGAQNRDSIDLASVNQLPKNEPCLNRLADSDVVSDHQADGGKAERHQQWNQLIGSGLESKSCGRPKRACPSSQGETERVSEESGSVLSGQSLAVREFESGRPDWSALQRRVKELNVGLRT